MTKATAIPTMAPVERSDLILLPLSLPSSVSAVATDVADSVIVAGDFEAVDEIAGLVSFAVQS